jgi:hypothetical protein
MAPRWHLGEYLPLRTVRKSVKFVYPPSLLLGDANGGSGSIAGVCECRESAKDGDS